MGEERRNRVNPIPEKLKEVLNEAQLMTLNKMEGFGWMLEFVRRPLFQDIIPVLFHPNSKEYGVLEDDGTVNTPPAKAGGFGLRLKAGLIGHAADPHLN